MELYSSVQNGSRKVLKSKKNNVSITYFSFFICSCFKRRSSLGDGFLLACAGTGGGSIVGVSGSGAFARLTGGGMEL